MTAQELRKREAAYRAVSRRYEQARTARNEAVSEALAEGWTHAQIAQATGLTRSRVGQLAQTGGDQ
jgi:DNA-binding NarL/FixJ family response regulator